MLILNCSENIIPHPALPAEESYRELSKLYVAMTRAKTELIISYAGKPSSFLGASLAKFTAGTWDTYAEEVDLPKDANIGEPYNNTTATDFADLTADAILYLPAAVGLSLSAQEKLAQTVTGTNRFKNNRQVEWKTFDELIKGIRSKSTLRASNSISDNVWEELQNLHTKLRTARVGTGNDKKLNQRTILSLPRHSEP